jgi:hypothetical protein
VRPFLISALLLTSLYAVVFVIERTPRMRFRPLPFRRRFFTSDATWYAFLVAMSAASMFVLRPVFNRITIDPIARYVGDLPAAGRFMSPRRDPRRHSASRCRPKGDGRVPGWPPPRDCTAADLDPTPGASQSDHRRSRTINPAGTQTVTRSAFTTGARRGNSEPCRQRSVIWVSSRASRSIPVRANWQCQVVLVVDR